MDYMDKDTGLNDKNESNRLKKTICTFPDCTKLIKRGARMCSKHIRMFYEAKSRQCNRGLSTEQIIGYAADHIGMGKRIEILRWKGWEEPHDCTGKIPGHTGAATKKALKYTLRIQGAQEQMNYPKIVCKYYSVFDKINNEYVKIANNSKTLKQAVEAVIKLNYATYSTVSSVENLKRMTFEEKIKLLEKDDYEMHRHNIRN